MAWNDLSISQRSQLMNIFRRNGVTSLSDMRSLYDSSLSGFNSSLEETTDLFGRPLSYMFHNGGGKGGGSRGELDTNEKVSFDNYTEDVKEVESSYAPSQDIINYIKKTEAFRPNWYLDGNGIPTIGYGFTGPEARRLFPNGITREQADKYFADSLAKRVPILAKDTPNWNTLTQNQRDALLSYHYNVGEGSYRNKHPKLQEALTNKDWENVMLNMDAGYTDRKNPGLRIRRDYERQLFKSGIPIPKPQRFANMTPYGSTDWLNAVHGGGTRSSGGPIHIDPSKKGTFTAAATKHDMGVQEFASYVSAHPDTFSSAMRKKAAFAKAAKKFKHSFGGIKF